MDAYEPSWESSYQDAPEKPNALKRFFFACAGAYNKILEACPSEHAKYVGIGATIFLTACLAVISGTFAIMTLVESPMVAVLAGIMWGALIFNLDRYIVSSIRKEGKVWHEVGLAFPRILLAVVISIVITKPIEVRLFDNQINSELFAYVADLERDAEKKVDQKLGIDSLNVALAEVDSARQQYKKMKDGRPTSFDYGEVNRDYAQAKQRYDSMSRVYLPRISANEAKRRDLWSRYATRKYVVDEAGNSKPDGWDFPPEHQETNNRIYQTNQALKAELATAEKEMLRYDKQRKSAREEFSQSVGEELAMLQSQREELIKMKDAQMIIREKELPGALEKARKYGIGFPAKIQALERLKENDSAMWWMSNLIVLLFMLLETSPIFVKLITKRGPYDYLLARIEHHKKVESLRYISDMNYDLNAALQLRSRKSIGEGINGSKASEGIISKN
ncbi:MAG: DUF4407 domain-containing protein [Bacteroidia bacterium]|nr:DUF4407 domain-containing protein [Bacteroidia bacterium]